MLTEIVTEWGFEDKVYFLVTDNAANIRTAIINVGWKYYGCYGHSIKFIVQNAISITQPQVDILEKVKTIVRFFKSKSTALKEHFKSQTN